MSSLDNPKSSLALPKTKKMILAIFGLGFSIAVFPFLLISLRYRQEIRQEAAISDTASAVLSLEPSSSNIDNNSLVSLEVYLNPDNQNVYAADIIISFNNNILRLNSINENTNTNFKTFAPITSQTSGDFDEVRVVTRANSEGIIEFGAATFNFDDPTNDPYNNPVNTPVLIATLNFSVRDGVGDVATGLSFDFAGANVTTDSNVVSVDRPSEDVDDILVDTQGASIIIGDPEQCQWHHCGDVDCDGVVDINDVSFFIDEFNGHHYGTRDADFDDDGDVDINDVSILITGFNDIDGTDCADTPH